jgi:hypothetical protein
MGAGASLDDANTGVNRLEEDTLALKCSAENAVGKKDFTAAELFYTKAIVKAPGAAQLWGGRAGMRNEIGEFGQALNDALNAIELAPVWPIGYFHAGVACLRLEKSVLALKFLQKSTALAPGVKHITQVYEEAVFAVKKIPQSMGNNVITWSGLSTVDPVVLGLEPGQRLGLRGTSYPKLVPSLRGETVTDIACGMSHTVAVTEGGDVYSWGRNVQGQCGSGVSSEAVTVPQLVPVLIGRKVRNVSCGAGHTVVTTESRGTWSWGIGMQGQLGHGDGVNKAFPVKLDFDEDTIAVECGIAHTVILSTGKQDTGTKLYVFGWNEHGQLGIGLDEQVCKTPTEVKTFRGLVSHVSCGGGHSSIVLTDGSVWMSGSNSCGQLGIGHLDDLITFKKVEHVIGKEPIALTTCGEEFTLFVAQSHKVYGTGLNNAGQVSTRLEDNFTIPTLVEEMLGKDVCSLACSQNEVYAVTTLGEVFSWGIPQEKATENQMKVKAGVATEGEIKKQTLEWAPKQVTTLKKKQIISLTCGRNHFAAIIVGTKANLCYIHNHEDKFAFVESGKRLKFKVQAVDSSGNEKSVGGDYFLITLRHELRGEFHFHDAFIDDNLDGSYDGIFKLPCSGRWTLGVLFSNMHIRDSPFTIECKMGSAELDKIEETKRMAEDVQRKADEDLHNEEIAKVAEKKKLAEAMENAKLLEDELNRLEEEDSQQTHVAATERKNEEERRREDEMLRAQDEERLAHEKEEARREATRQKVEEERIKRTEEEARREAVRQKVERERTSRQKEANDRIEQTRLEHEARLKQIKDREQDHLRKKREMDAEKRKRIMDKLREEEMSRRKKKEDLAKKEQENKLAEAQKRRERNEKRTGGGWVVNFDSGKHGGWVGDALPPMPKAAPAMVSKKHGFVSTESSFADLDLLDAQPRKFGGNV